MAVWSQPGHWCKVILRATAIERRAYLDVGGFETEYGRFAEFALAARLHATGKRLGYASGANVRHVYTSGFDVLEPEVEDFLRGELAYRLDYPAEYCERYFGAPAEWVERRLISKEGSRAAWRLAFRALLSGTAWRERSIRSLLSTLRRLTPAALFGPHPALVKVNLAYAVARLRCLLWRFADRRLLRAYRDAWSSLTRRARIRYLAEHPTVPAESPVAARFALDQLPDDRLFGFHDTESVNGTTFRWSRTVAFADVPVDPAAYRVEIDTGGIRDLRNIALQVFFNGRRVERSRLEIGTRRISFPIEAGDFNGESDQRLAFVSAGFRPSRIADSPDSRELALPISSINFTRPR
jgi:hypothetical protein